MFESPLQTERAYQKLFDLELQKLPPELAESWDQYFVERTEEYPTAIARYEGLLRRLRRRNEGGVDMTLRNKELIQTPEDEKRFQRLIEQVMQSVNKPEFFIGNGASANVFHFNGDETACVKVIHNSTVYNQGNSLREEALFLMEVHAYETATVRAPLFYFYAPTYAHTAYCMERLDALNLSLLLAGSVRHPRAEGIDPEAFGAALEEYVRGLYAQGIAHGDLTPRNVMIDKQTMNPRVIDFGKARRRFMMTPSEWEELTTRELLTVRRMRDYLVDFKKGARIDVSKQM